ncbi:hypothetical protein BST61_g6617 [Cercospora zeina]
MPAPPPFIATKAESCTHCGIQRPKDFLLPNRTKHGEKKSPCKHNVGVCNFCGLEYLKVEIPKAQALSEKQQQEKMTDLTEIKCMDCEEVLRNVDVFMRGGSDLFDVYQSIRASESNRAAAELGGARKGEDEKNENVVQDPETARAERYNAFNAWKWKT